MERQAWYLVILQKMNKKSEEAWVSSEAESELRKYGAIFSASILSRDEASAIVVSLREILAALPVSRDRTSVREYLESLIRECDLERVS
jgi:hypothetical protein